MTGVLVGMAVMAAGSIWLRGRGADARLRPALGLLALFALGLALILALDGSRLEDWQALALPLLPPLLAQHLRSLAGPVRWPRAEVALGASGLLCLPFLLLPDAARATLSAGQMPKLDPARILVALAGVALFWPALCLGTAVAGLGLWRALRRQRAALEQILAQPSPRISGVAVLGEGLAALFGL